MLKRPNWKVVGEATFIFLFCISYALLANVQSRIFGTPQDSIAYKVRTMVDFELRLEQKHYCEDEAAKRYKDVKSKMIWVWYENSVTHEYWCGLLDPDTLTDERLMELAPHIVILNSDRVIKRYATNESNKHIGRRGYIQPIGQR